MEPIDTEGLRRFARMTIVWTYIYLGVALFSAAMSLTAVLMPPDDPDSPLIMVDTAAAIAQFVIFLIAGIIILTWIYRANKTAQLLSGDGVPISPGWNVGWFFVPIASLWKPFEGVRETYQASVSPDTPHRVDVPGAMRLWWGSWIVSNILSNLAFRLQTMAEGPGGQAAANVLYAIDGIVAIPLCLALIATIRDITEAQVATNYAEAFA